MLMLLLAVALSAAPHAVAAEPGPPQTLSGIVTDTAGRPLSLVRITVLEAHRSTTTGPEGHYSLPGLPAGTYGVSFALVGYAPQVHRVTIGDSAVTLDVVMRPTLIELPEVQVTASPLATTSLTSPQPTSLLSSEELQANRSSSLGETISTLPGVRSLNTGAGIGKPVIRGLSS